MTRISRRSFPLILSILALLASHVPARLLAAQDASLDVPTTDAGLPGDGPIRRAEWFVNHWRNRRTAWAERAEQDRGALVFLGDSITEGFGDDFHGAFPGVKAANRGISGDTSRGMLIRLKRDVLSLDPSGVVLLLGTNDLEEQAEPETIAGNLELILAALKQHDSEIPIVLCKVFPSSASKRRPADQIKKLNDLYAKLVYDNPQVTIVDTWTLFADESGDAPAELFPDLLHLNDAGYAKWAAAIRPVLATLGYLETEPDDFALEPGFESLFNGRDLTGWGLRPTPPEDIAAAARWKSGDPNAPPWPVVTEAKSFDGQTASDDGRYVAVNGRLVVTTPSEGRRIQQLWTTREFPDDFVLKLEFRATPNADSGVFIRKPQLQCRDYALAGPYKELASYKPQDWNELVVDVTGGVARCTCNGEVIEAEFAVPETGPIGLEGDRGQMEYRRIRIKTK